ncbi:protein unc-93 homolog A-like [Ornithodoros turicata]|uniref:protein unc-93 homolog A-like n=1 Tax=Ornithodoros turicata TaxID=34597 RepID=UPI003139FC9D
MDCRRRRRSPTPVILSTSDAIVDKMTDIPMRDEGLPQIEGPPRDLQMTPEQKKLNIKGKIYFNLFVVSMGFLLLFIAYQSLQILQSSINAVGGLGTTSLATTYVALVVSCMFLPSYMIQRLGLKYTMAASMVMYLTYFLANMKPMWITLLPASFILGMGGAPLWTAKCSYVSFMAQKYADLEDLKDATPIVTGFFGLFFMVFQTSQVWGNLISYMILRPSNNSATVSPSFTEFCGASFHPTRDLFFEQTLLSHAAEDKRFMLAALYSCIVVFAIALLLLFLDPTAREVRIANPPIQILVESVGQMGNLNQLLLIPVTVYSGLQQAFIWSDYTQAFISCSWGVPYVGFVMVWYGVADSLGSVTFGFMVKIVGRIPLMLMAALMNSAAMIAMLKWHPTPTESHNYFVIAIIWGIADSSWQTQLNALYGVLFSRRRNAAFSNYRLWESMGFIVMFSVQSTLRLYVKIVVLMTMLVVATIGYLVVEYRENGFLEI